MMVSFGQRSVVAISFGLLFAAVTIVAARWGIADVGLRSAEHHLANWLSHERAGEAGPDVGEWTRVRGELLRASQMHARNPAFAELQAVLGTRPVGPESEVRVRQAEALDHLRRAAVARPVSAHNWANIAWWKYQLGELDGEFHTAFRSAAMLGPWERDVQLTLIDIGLALWDEGGETVRQTTRGMLENGLLRLASEVVWLAEKRDRLQVVCGYENAAKVAACKTLLAGAK